VKLLEEPRPADARTRSVESDSNPDPLPPLIELFRMLADERRMRILRLLMEGDEYHVGALCKKLGQSQPAVSHHLAQLLSAGLIERRRQGKRNFYHLRPAKLEEVLDQIFVGKPAADRRVRLGKYMLSCDA
jgi:ArsR family transcriptional regulator